MREIKFRGKSLENGEWIYGSLINNLWVGSLLSDNPGRNICQIITTDYIEHDNWQDVADSDKSIITVDPVTVGQFVFFMDMDGKDVYVGDILSEKWKVEVYQNDDGAFMVRFNNNPKMNKPKTLKSYLSLREKAGTSDRDCKVIGNVHEGITPKP